MTGTQPASKTASVQGRQDSFKSAVHLSEIASRKESSLNQKELDSIYEDLQRDKSKSRQQKS